MASTRTGFLCSSKLRLLTKHHSIIVTVLMCHFDDPKLYIFPSECPLLAHEDLKSVSPPQKISIERAAALIMDYVTKKDAKTCQEVKTEFLKQMPLLWGGGKKVHTCVTCATIFNNGGKKITGRNTCDHFRIYLLKSFLIHYSKFLDMVRNIFFLWILIIRIRPNLL